MVADAAAGAEVGVDAVAAAALAAETALAAEAALAADATTARAAELAAGVCTTIGVGVRSGEFSISDGASARLLTSSPGIGEPRGTVRR